MKWKTLVASQNAKTYVLPEGWDSKEKVASDLECGEDRVRILLAPAIKSGAVEVNMFPIWDSRCGRVVRLTAYRKTIAKKPTRKRSSK